MCVCVRVCVCVCVCHCVRLLHASELVTMCPVVSGVCQLRVCVCVPELCVRCSSCDGNHSRVSCSW